MYTKKLSLFYLIPTIIIIIFFIFITKKVYENNILLKNIKLIKYTPGTNIFSDRNYKNIKNDKILEDKYLIQLPRHLKNNLILISNSDLIIYRSLCDKNENNIYNNWKKIYLKINISGVSCKHSSIVMRKFNSGQIELNSGGPISSDPIFIHGLKKEENIIIKID